MVLLSTHSLAKNIIEAKLGDFIGKIHLYTKPFDSYSVHKYTYERTHALFVSTYPITV